MPGRIDVSKLFYIFELQAIHMIDWITVVLLIALGLSLVVVEIIFIPGTTVVGIIGFVMMGFGIFMGYQNFGATTGTIVLVLTFIASLVIIITSFKSGVWKRFSNKRAIKSKVNVGYTEGLQVELRGEAVSALRPIGKAEFNDKEYEVTSLGEYIPSGTALKIIRIEKNKIFVEPINNK